MPACQSAKTRRREKSVSYFHCAKVCTKGVHTFSHLHQGKRAEHAGVPLFVLGKIHDVRKLHWRPRRQNQDSKMATTWNHFSIWRLFCWQFLNLEHLRMCKMCLCCV